MASKGNGGGSNSDWSPQDDYPIYLNSEATGDYLNSDATGNNLGTSLFLSRNEGDKWKEASEYIKKGNLTSDFGVSPELEDRYKQYEKVWEQLSEQYPNDRSTYEITYPQNGVTVDYSVQEGLNIQKRVNNIIQQMHQVEERAKTVDPNNRQAVADIVDNMYDLRSQLNYNQSSLRNISRGREFEDRFGDDFAWTDTNNFERKWL